LPGPHDGSARLRGGDLERGCRFERGKLPNTLAHLGIQTLATRGAIRAPDPKWIFLGCAIPDLPWIARRIAPVLWPEVDPIALRLYAIAQSALVISLLLCGALALMSRAPKKIFAILALNVLLHLLLDALQTKWGNGVHLFAPISWKVLNLGLFWPESAVTLALTLLGLGVVGWSFWRGVEKPAGLCGRPPRRLLFAALLLGAYFALPALLLGDVEASDTHFLHTIRSAAGRVGHEIAIDRTELVRDARGDRLRLYSGEEVAVVGLLPARSAVVSVRGRFRDAHTLVIEALHVHAGRLRDFASYIGLSAVALAWMLPTRVAPRAGQARKPRRVR